MVVRKTKLFLVNNALNRLASAHAQLARQKGTKTAPRRVQEEYGRRNGDKRKKARPLHVVGQPEREDLLQTHERGHEANLAEQLRGKARAGLRRRRALRAARGGMPRERHFRRRFRWHQIV